MKKRLFLKTGAALTAGSLLSPLQSCMNQPKPTITNWSGNLIYSTKNIDYPSSLDELSSIVKKHSKIKALGTQHCFNNIADSEHHLVSTKNLNEIISIDKVNHTVHVEPGIKYGTLAAYLQKEGFALHNLASLPHISVGGACTTATHGSGINNGNLATQVVAFDLLHADGNINSYSKTTDANSFNAALIGLGALGIFTKMTLSIEPTYQVRQDVFENLPFEMLKSHFEEIMSAGYSVSLFTDWMNNNVSEVWIKSKMIEDQPFTPLTDLFGARPATKNIHPIIELDAINCTGQLGIPGPWHERLPHFKMNFTPSSGKELQAEYLIPIEYGYEALKAINDHGTAWKNDLFISEIRTINADDLWMSTASQRKSVAIHFTWKQQDNVYQLLPKVEALLKPFAVRPHWGKLFALDKKYFQSVYPRYGDFQAFVKELDPNGKFSNKYLQDVL